MTWLVWRQHRKQLLFGVAALGVLAAFFLATGLPMREQFEQLGLADCLPQTIEATTVANLFGDVGTDAGDVRTEDSSTAAVTVCAQAAREFFSGHQYVFDTGLLLLILPMLAGMFWGAPLVARELEHGTHRLVWTQSTSRLRWAATKVGLVATAVLLMTAVYAALLTWWITPVIQTSGQRFDYMIFDMHGIVVFGYVVFALALGIFAGAVTKRLLPAMAMTVVGFLGARIVVMLVARPNYLATETERFSTGVQSEVRWNELHGDWIVSRPSGRTGCAAGASACFDTVTVHPARHFWAFQAIEVSIFVALAVGLLIASIYWVRRRID
jgi:hypothetical protein